MLPPGTPGAVEGGQLADLGAVPGHPVDEAEVIGHVVFAIKGGVVDRLDAC